MVGKIVGLVAKDVDCMDLNLEKAAKHYGVQLAGGARIKVEDAGSRGEISKLVIGVLDVTEEDVGADAMNHIRRRGVEAARRKSNSGSDSWVPLPRN